jgi:hypothetical protein
VVARPSHTEEKAMNKDVVLQEERGERVLLVTQAYPADFW